MNTPKHIAGIALFILIVGVSALIASIVAAPLQIIPPIPIHAPQTLNEQVSHVNYKVQLVSLDFINRESYTTLRLKRQTDGPAPEKLWLYSSFFVPESPRKQWSSTPVEIVRPFAEGDEVSLTIAGACPMCEEANAPRAGYYARVVVSTVPSESDCRLGERAVADIKTAIPVLVQVEQNTRR